MTGAEEIGHALVLLNGGGPILAPHVRRVEPADVGAVEEARLAELLIALGANVEFLPEPCADGVVELVGVAHVDRRAWGEPDVALLAGSIRPQLVGRGVGGHTTAQGLGFPIRVEACAAQLTRQDGAVGDGAVGWQLELVAARPARAVVAAAPPGRNASGTRSAAGASAAAGGGAAAAGASRGSAPRCRHPAASVLAGRGAATSEGGEEDRDPGAE